MGRCGIINGFMKRENHGGKSKSYDVMESTKNCIKGKLRLLKFQVKETAS
jgi:hypothetical protein